MTNHRLMDNKRLMDILNNRIIKTELVEWKKLIPFQPDNLKKTEPHKLQKLANSLCQNGFSMNFYVWEKEGQIFIIDGHSRWEVLQLLEENAISPKDPSGKEYAVTVPDKLPCSFLHLKNKTEAKKAVLIYNSKYKNIDSDILAEWVSDLNLDELKSQIEIPELKLDFDLGHEANNMSEDDIDVNEEFDPIGTASNLLRIVFLFDTEEEGQGFMIKRLPDMEIKKVSGGQGKIWQVNLSQEYGRK